MARQPLDLTGLDMLAALTETCDGATGAPLELLLADVVEDPAQPRTVFSEASIASLAEQIRASKVLSPISVRPKNADGKYLINHGARRYRASLLAGKLTIPGFIDATHDDYDQLAENIQREDLASLDIARAIKKLMARGAKKGEIASKLGKPPSFITEHLALVDAPPFLQALADNKAVGLRTLYDLIQIYGAFPAATQHYVEHHEEVTRAGVAALLRQLKSERMEAGATVADHAVTMTAPHDSGMPCAATGQANMRLPEPAGTDPGRTDVVSCRRGVEVRVGDRRGTILPECTVQIRYHDTGTVADVPFTDLAILGIADGKISS